MKVFIGDEERDIRFGEVPKGLRIDGKRPHRIEISMHDLMEMGYMVKMEAYLKALSSCMKYPVVTERSDIDMRMILKTVEEKV